MKTEKKVAFLMYPNLCYFEVAMILELLVIYEKKVDTFAIDKQPMRAEDGVLMVADYTLDEFNIDEYDCLLLTGIGGDPTETIYDNRYKTFLEQFQGREDYLIACMSCSPALIARAGLLENKKYCCGLYEESFAEFPFMGLDTLVRAPLVTDGNVVTAMFQAYREFAIEVVNQLGIDIPKDAMSGAKHPINPEEYIFHFPTEKES